MGHILEGVLWLLIAWAAQWSVLWLPLPIQCTTEFAGPAESLATLNLCRIALLARHTILDHLS